MTRNTANDDHYSARAGALGGAVAGIIAGLVMAMVAMARAAALGMELWLPPKQIAAVVYGVEALIGGAGVIIVGLLIHMMISAGYGLLFGLLVGRRASAFSALLGGLVYGTLIWAVMTWLILPWTNEVMLERVSLMPTWWWIYHLIFGGMLVLTPSLVKAFIPNRERAVHEH